jgi:hypothetical protein
MIIATIPMMRLKLVTGSHAGKGTCPKPLQREASGLEKERQLGAMLTFEPMDAIKLLTRDHRSVERLFKAYERAGERALKEKQRLAGQIIRDLSIHASVEEQFLYPTARELSEKLDDQVLEALEEHHLAKATLAEVEKMSPSDERFDAKMTVLEDDGTYGERPAPRRGRRGEALPEDPTPHGQRGSGFARGSHGGS